MTITMISPPMSPEVTPGVIPKGARAAGRAGRDSDEIERRRAEHHERIRSDRLRQEEAEEREREAVDQAELDDLVGLMGLPDPDGSMRAVEELSDMERGEDADDLPPPFDDADEDDDEYDPYEAIEALAAVAHAKPGDGPGLGLVPPAHAPPPPPAGLDAPRFGVADAPPGRTSPSIDVWRRSTMRMVGSVPTGRRFFRSFATGM